MRSRLISQFSSETVGVAIYEEGLLIDPEGSVVTVSIRNEYGDLLLESVPAVKDGVGLYSYVLQPVDTRLKGEYQTEWYYVLNGEVKQFLDAYTVTDPMPYWDSLTEEQRDSVLNIYFKVSNTFDSAGGGPYLWEIQQSGFNPFETIARLMCTDAISYINFTRAPAFNPPFQVVGLPPGTAVMKPFPAQAYGLLEKATYVEFLKHLSRSYIEQPDVEGVSTARFDRRKYRDLWAQEAAMEKAELERWLSIFKRKYLFTGRSMLVAGGLFNHIWYDPTRPRWLYTATAGGNVA